MLDLAWLGVAAAPFIVVFTLISCFQCFKRKPSQFSNLDRSANANSGHLNTTFVLDTGLDDTMPTAVVIDPLPDILSKVKAMAYPPRITCLDRSKQDTASLQLIGHHAFPRSQLVYLKELGSGWFGKVIESDADKIVTGIPTSKVVVKMLRDDASKSEQLLFLEEVAPFRELEHSNILRLLGQCTEMNPMLMILEAAALGNLKLYLRNHRQHKDVLIQKNRLLQFAVDAACGLACLHRHDYIHRDLASRNCLVMGNHTLKIGDYGIAEDLFQEDYYKTGKELLPIRWMGPQTLKQENGKWMAHNFTKESDVWSFGVLLWEISMLGERPYDMLTDEAVLQGVVLEKEIHLPQPNLQSGLYEVMKHCWLDPSERAKIEDIYSLLQQVSTQAASFTDYNSMEEFEEKWKHLFPNNPRLSIDSNRESRQSSITSVDMERIAAQIEDDFSENLTTGTQLPSHMQIKKKLSVSEAAVAGLSPLQSKSTEFDKDSKVAAIIAPSPESEFTDFAWHNDTLPTSDLPTSVVSHSVPMDTSVIQPDEANQNGLAIVLQNKQQNSVSHQSNNVVPCSTTPFHQDSTQISSTPNSSFLINSVLNAQSSPSNYSTANESIVKSVLNAQSSPSNYSTANESTVKSESHLEAYFTDTADGCLDTSFGSFDVSDETAVSPTFKDFPMNDHQSERVSSLNSQPLLNPLEQNSLTSLDQSDSFGEFTNAFGELENYSGPEIQERELIGNDLQPDPQTIEMPDLFKSELLPDSSGNSSPEMQTQGIISSSMAVDSTVHFPSFSSPPLSSLIVSSNINGQTTNTFSDLRTDLALTDAFKEADVPIAGKSIAFHQLATDANGKQQHFTKDSQLGDFFTFESSSETQIPTEPNLWVDTAKIKSQVAEISADDCKQPDTKSGPPELDDFIFLNPESAVSSSGSLLETSSTELDTVSVKSDSKLYDIDSHFFNIEEFVSTPMLQDMSQLDSVVDPSKAPSGLDALDLLADFSSMPSSSEEYSHVPPSHQEVDDEAPSSMTDEKVGIGVEGHTTSSESSSVDTESTTSDSGKEYSCEESCDSPASSPHLDNEEYALLLASELYLSKGLRLARPFDTPTLEPIPEDPIPSISEESLATPSETSSVDVRFEEDVFEWDDYIGEPWVGKEQVIEGSPKHSFEITDWSLDQDSVSSSVHSQHSDRASEGSSSTRSLPVFTDTEVPLSGTTSRTSLSHILTHRTTHLPQSKNFYSLYEEDDFDFELDSQSESPPPNLTLELKSSVFQPQPQELRTSMHLQPQLSQNLPEADANR